MAVGGPAKWFPLDIIDLMLASALSLFTMYLKVKNEGLCKFGNDCITVVLLQQLSRGTHNLRRILYFTRCIIGKYDNDTMV